MTSPFPSPFAYPTQRYRRRHAPRGYKKYRQYRPWLRDEFSFRCVYCLKRETWNPQRKEWHLDHFVPQAECAAKRNDYDNLVYSCASCNLTKSNSRVPDPCQVAYGEYVQVNEEGKISWRGKNGQRLIRELGLDNEDYTGMRRKFLKLHRAAQEDPDLMREFFGYPDNLPDLTLENPPDGNDNKASETQSYHARRNDLPGYF